MGLLCVLNTDGLHHYRLDRSLHAPKTDPQRSDVGGDEPSGYLLDRQETSSKQYMQIHNER